MNLIEKLHSGIVKVVEGFLDKDKSQKKIDEQIDEAFKYVTKRQTRGNVMIQWGRYDDSQYEEKHPQ